MAVDNKPSPEAKKSQLERILQSAEFRATDNQRQFLRFVVDETLEGRSSEIKGCTIAVDVYGRTEKFDPQAHPIVRLEAGRLRRSLENYYQRAGRNDPVRIEIPKGGYVPTFHTVQAPQSVDKSHTPEIREVAPPTETSIVVMPLINLTNDKEQDYFVDGLTEELTIELTRHQEFQVISSQSTIWFKGRQIDPIEVGKPSFIAET